MGDTLEIFGKEFTGVTGFKAKDNNGNTLIYTRGGSGGGGTITIEEIPNATGTTLQITTNGSGGGGSTPSATQHDIYYEFADETNVTIPVYYDDSEISSMIRTSKPTTYGAKTIELAKLDGTTWYVHETWTTIFDGYATAIPEEGDPPAYFWISALSDVQIPLGSVWKVTIESDEYRTTAKAGQINGATVVYIGRNWTDSADDDSGYPFSFYNRGYGAWMGGCDLPTEVSYHIVIEQLVTS